MSELHDLGVLEPLYYLTDVADSDHRINVAPQGGLNARGWLYEAASTGRLREVVPDDRTSHGPYVRPADETDHRWWNGFLYSSWQLVDVRHALSELGTRKHFGTSSNLAEECRPRTLALCALATRHLPAILGSYSVPSGFDRDLLWQSRYDINDQKRLALAGIDPAQLLVWAEELLQFAHSIDPMIEWLPVLRHASARGWEKLHGPVRDAHWMRVAAEVLLRGYESAVEEGDVPALPQLTQQGWWSPLHDRLTARGDTADSLDRALGSFGLSPHPRVLLLLEGKTEMVHLPRLLAIDGLDRPDLVRLQNLGGVNTNPQLIARYAISPRVGQILGEHQLLDAIPTALVIAVDPEGNWATEAQRLAGRRRIQNAIREEVIRQGADITDENLDFLVQIHTWGELCYELANFTDSELADALVKLAREQNREAADTPEWRERAADEFTKARDEHLDAGVAMGRMRVREDKPRFAEILWPVLEHKIRDAAADGLDGPPVYDLLLTVRDTVERLPAGSYLLEQPARGVVDERLGG